MKTVMYIDKGQMKPKIPSRMDGLDTQATWDTRHITNTSKTKTNITQNTKKMSNTDPTKKPRANRGGHGR